MVSGKIVNKTIIIAAPVVKVWNALTNPELVKLWVSDTEINIISDWNVGSNIVFTYKLYKTEYNYKGTILKFETGKVFQYSSYSSISRLPDASENYSVIDFTLTPKENQTVLTLTHSNLMGEASFEHSNFYWGVTLSIIKKLVEKV